MPCAFDFSSFPGGTAAGGIPAGPLALSAGDFGLVGFDGDPGLRIFDDVQSQAAYAGLSDGQVIPSGVGKPWRANGTIAGKIDNVLFSTDASKKRYAGDTGRYYAASGSGSPGFLSEPDAMPQGHTYPGGVYASWWFRPEGAIATSGNSTKIIRLWGTSSSERYLSWTTDKLDILTDYGLTGHTPDNAIWKNITLTDQWVRYEQWTDARTLSATVFRGWENNLVWDQEGQTTVTADASAMVDLPWVETLGWDTGGPTPSYNAWSMKDIYISSYANRFELADSATWGSRTHSEVQPITSWNAGAPQITLFYGAHSATGPLWLHYIDRDNAPAGTPMQVRAS